TKLSHQKRGEALTRNPTVDEHLTGVRPLRLNRTHPHFPGGGRHSNRDQTGRHRPRLERNMERPLRVHTKLPRPNRPTVPRIRPKVKHTLSRTTQHNRVPLIQSEMAVLLLLGAVRSKGGEPVRGGRRTGNDSSADTSASPTDLGSTLS